MSLDLTQQIVSSIERSKRILITFKEHHSIDSVVSALSLQSILKKLGKESDIACENFSPQKQLEFILQNKKIIKSLKSSTALNIIVDISETKLKELEYNTKDNNLIITITSSNGNFKPENVTAKNAPADYDLIFVIDSSDLISLGNIYNENIDFFYNTSIINIDHNPENESFGQINLVELTTSSVSEIIFNLCNNLDPTLIDEEISTLLLTGIISKTRSFKDPLLTPQSLHIVSKLMDRGAKREIIIENLYRTKTLSTLRLWGRALARLSLDEEHGIAWTKLQKNDFEASGSEQDCLIDIIPELISSSPQAKIVALFFETSGNEVGCIIDTNNNINLKKIFETFNSTGSNNNITFYSYENIITLEQTVLETLKIASKELK